MDRRDRDRYDRNDYRGDYGRYEDYDRGDEHYHSARNLTNEFERDYQHDRGGRWDEDRGRYQPERTYHEGDMGGAYERMSRRGGSVRDEASYDMINRDRYRGYSGDYDRDRYQKDDFREERGMYRGDQDMYRRDLDRDRDRDSDYRNMMGYGSSARYNDHERNRDFGRRGDEEDYYSGSGGDDRRSRYGGSMYGRDIRSEDSGYESYRNRYY